MVYSSELNRIFFSSSNGTYNASTGGQDYGDSVLAANPDGTFKSADDLRAIYEKEQGLSNSDDVIAYCRIGERSSHTWFVLTYLLGYPNVRNYDGSWTEWGNAVRVPIER